MGQCAPPEEFRRNRRASTTLSPILYLFQIPTSTLYQKLQQILLEVIVPPVVEEQRRPGPKEIPLVDRTTFLRQAANLWAVKERIWCLIRDSLLPYDPRTAIIDS